MQKTEAIIFDLGGVILDIDYNLTRAAFEKLGVRNFDEMYSQSGADMLFRNLETGKISENDFCNELNRCTGLRLSSTEIIEAWNAILLDFREGSLQFLEKIKPKYTLYLLSNTNHIHITEFNKIYNKRKREKPFAEFFDKVYFSCEIGLRKPDAECYHWVLQKENLVPQKTLFVDDSIQNVDAAKAAGMKTVLLERGQYIEDLSL